LFSYEAFIPARTREEPSNMDRRLRRAALCAVSFALLAQAAATPRQLRAQPPPAAQPESEQAKPEQAKSEAERWREDLRVMAEEMPRRHKNLFHTLRREQFDAAVRGLHERIPALARHQIIVELARIAASVGDGHTNVAPTRDPKIGFRAYPLKLYLFKDGLHVRAAAREHAALVGARVVRIGDAPVERAYDAVREIVGRDNEMNVKFFAPSLLAMPEVLHALGLVADMEAAPFTFERDGRRWTASLRPAGPFELMAPDTDASWVAKEGWVDARDGAGTPPPLWLRDPLNKFWFEHLPAERAVYVQFNRVANKEDETIEAFARRLSEFVEANPVERLVLDLRLNRGGNGSLNRPLLLGLIKSRKLDARGRLLVLVGRSTWSAAQMLVNELERYTNAVFVGEPTGGKPNHFGDSRRITLPNSGVTVRVSTLWWQQDERDRRLWTAPQVAADLTSADYRANRDPALRAALAYSPRRTLRELLVEAATTDPKSAAARLKEWADDPSNAYTDAQPQVARAGYELLAARRLDQAVEIFKLGVANFPQSADAHAGLAEAYAAKGERELAIKSFERALELRPGWLDIADALKRLRDGRD
jgi:tetratricopeptide (TPR) repeat protein